MGKTERMSKTCFPVYVHVDIHDCCYCFVSPNTHTHHSLAEKKNQNRTFANKLSTGKLKSFSSVPPVFSLTFVLTRSCSLSVPCHSTLPWLWLLFITKSALVASELRTSTGYTEFSLSVQLCVECVPSQRNTKSENRIHSIFLFFCLFSSFSGKIISFDVSCSPFVCQQNHVVAECWTRKKHRIK